MFNWFNKYLIAWKRIRYPVPPANSVTVQTDLSNNGTAFKSRGDAFLAQGKFVEAEENYRQAIACNPAYAEACNNLGNALREQKRDTEAEYYFRQAISINPGIVAVHYNLGTLLQEHGKLHEAVESFNAALVVKPDFAEALFNLGGLFKATGKIAEAIYYYQRVLAIKPDLIEAYLNLGKLLREQGKSDEAITCYQQALVIKPDFTETQLNLGIVFHELGRLDEAIVCYHKVLVINPVSAEAYLNLGNALHDQGKAKEAVASYQKALVIAPDFFEAHINLGVVLNRQGNSSEAFVHYQKALVLKPEAADVHYNFGITLVDQGKLIEAIACFGRVLKYQPEHYAAQAGILHQSQHICTWENMEFRISQVRKVVQEAPATSNSKNWIPPFVFLALPGATSAEQKFCAEKYVQRTYQPLHSLRQELNFEFQRPPNEKIHLAYLSSDLHDHATARLMASVFELHDRSRFHVTAYSYGPDDRSAMRKRLERAFDQFVDIRNDTHESVAQKIYADHIDILVDLKGYTQNNRSEILALRPAPIQVNYLGYPGTMGANFIDYLIADRFVVPPEQFGNYSEKIIWLPDCYQPTDPTRPHPAAPTRKACGLPEQGTVFCCFNQTYKITPPVFDVWCRLLQAIPDSVLWLFSSNIYAADNLRREAESRGVNPERLIMADSLGQEEHLARLQCADLFLDTIPVNAHTTCSDALWMGLPVITCVGNTFAARVAGSLLVAMGVPELITYSLQDYYNLAFELATDSAKREQIRQKIIANRFNTALFDSKRFTCNLEIAYTAMMSKHYGLHEW